MISAVDRWGSSASRIWRVPVCQALTPYVISIVVLDRDDDEIDQVCVLPDSRATLLFSINAGVRINRVGGFADAEGSLTLLGVPTRGGSTTIHDVPLTIVVTFTPIGAHMLSGVPMDELINRAVELDQLCGQSFLQLKHALTRALSNDERLALLEAYLDERFHCCGGSALRASRQVALAAGASGHAWNGTRPPPQSLLPAARASDRHLRRLFKHVVGLTPHTMLRVERFNRAVQLARCSAAPQWAEIALRAGYYDQAHMIAEFNAFVGLPPIGFFSALGQGLPHLQGRWFKEDVVSTTPLAALEAPAQRRGSDSGYNAVVGTPADHPH